MSNPVENESRVELTLPRARRGEAEDLFVGFNGVNYLIPKGRAVEVPAAVAEEVARARAAEEFRHDAALALQKGA